MARTKRTSSAALLVICFAIATLSHGHMSNGKKIVIYGATGTMGSAFVEEALLRGYDVVGVSRDVSKFDHIEWPGFTGVQGDITDIDSVRSIIMGADVVLVSVMGSPQVSYDEVTEADQYTPQPEDSVQHVGALNLIAVSRELGDAAPRIIQINGGSTLYYNGQQLFHYMPPGIAPAEGTGGYSIMWGHHVVLETYEDTEDVRWTVATPQPGTEFGVRGERTRRPVEVLDGNLQTDAERLELTADGNFVESLRHLGEITAIDFGVAIFDEIENENFIQSRFTARYTD